MYTLEDDKETTSSLRKRDLPPTSHAPGEPASATPGAAPTEANNGETSDPQRKPLSAQITQSLKKITTPAPSRQAQAGERGVSLAAFPIVFIGVFFSTMGQMVVVYALSLLVNA